MSSPTKATATAPSPSAPSHFGNYTLVAIDDGRNLPYNEPGALTPYLANGQSVTLPLEKDSPVEVEVQTRK